MLFLPADEADLASFLKGLDPQVPVTMLGVGSNTLVRDGGVEGVVIRLGRAFAEVIALDGGLIRAGAAALDGQVSKAAAAAGIAGLEFYTGVPGTVGGALVMNAGCYTQETKDVLVEAYGLTRQGEPVTFSNAQMRFSYRKSATAAETGTIFIGALFRGVPDDAAEVTRRMQTITERREQSQPIREKTGGSTFKNPPGHSAWKLVEEAGWRGKPVGGAMFSPLHSNFLINTGEATAAELEALGEAVRRDVKRKRGLELDWEIKRIGRPLD